MRPGFAAARASHRVSTEYGLGTSRRDRVQGSRQSELRLEGVAVFNARHGLAPNGTLLFEALDQLATAPPLVLSLETTDKAIALKTDSLGRFVLPTTDVAGSNVGEIVSNRPSGLLKIKPLVLSTGTSGSSRRLGDLRLQCEVLWAIEKHDVCLLYTSPSPRD